VTTAAPAKPVAAARPVGLTPAEAAAYLGVHPWTIYKLVNDGDLRAFRMTGEETP
jgi:excisionase family DNA binding protein